MNLIPGRRQTDAPPAGPSRRAFLAGAATAAAGLAYRPAATWADGGSPTAYIVADAATGEVLEARNADRPAVPASVVKVLTALYALETLGASDRFHTRLLAAGPSSDGRLTGDLVLAGDGDPLLDTDALGELLVRARRGGLSGVDGQLLVADGALPALERIEADQPEAAGYNPAISGAGLNFNRVEFTPVDRRNGRQTFRAPGRLHTVEIGGFAAEPGDGPPAHRLEADREVWTLPAPMLNGGPFWLPVRRPADYTGRVLRALGSQQNLSLPEARVVGPAPDARSLVAHQSPPMVAIIRGMLHHSTNLTAEVLGLRAGIRAGAAPEDLPRSATAMSRWARDRYGLRAVHLANHSGLTDRSRLSAGDMLRVLLAERGRLPDLLRLRDVLDADGRPMDGRGVRLQAKTGTLDFVSALAGYLDGPRGRTLAFAIFASDLERREAVPASLRDYPPGARAWAARARAEQQALMRRWAGRHFGAGGALRPRPRPLQMDSRAY